MFTERERMTYGDEPTPDQLRELLFFVTQSVASRKHLKTVSIDKKHPAHYFVDQVESVVFGDSGLQEIRHRLAGRIGAKRLGDEALKRYSLKYFDTIWIYGDSSGGQASRTTYRFEWDIQDVHLADRVTRYISPNGGRDISLGEELQNLSLRDDEADWLNAQNEYSRVTQQEIEGIKNNIQEYFWKIEQYQKIANLG